MVQMWRFISTMWDVKLREVFKGAKLVKRFISTMWDVKEDEVITIDAGEFRFISTMWDVKVGMLAGLSAKKKVLSRLCGM